MQTTMVSETVSILCVLVLFLLTCTCGMNSHTSSLALLQEGFLDKDLGLPGATGQAEGCVQECDLVLKQGECLCVSAMIKA